MKNLSVGLLTVLMLLACPSLQSEQLQETEQTQELQNQVDPAENINKYSAALLRLNERLLEVFQSTGHYINKGNSNLNSEQKKAATKWVQENQKNINYINKQLIDTPSENLITQYATKINCMVLNLNVAIISNFKNLINTDITIKRSVLLEPHAIEIDSVIADVDTKLGTASKKINNLGLTNLNLAVRKLEDIDFRYGITPKIKTALMGAFVLWVAWIFTPETYLDSLKHKLNVFDFWSKTQTKLQENNVPAEPSKSNTNSRLRINPLTRRIESRFPKKQTKAKKTDANSGKKSLVKGFLGGIISAVLLDAYKKDGGDFIKDLHHNFLSGISSGASKFYSLLRGSGTKIGSNGYEYVSSSNTLEDQKLVGLEDQKQALGQLVNALKNLQVFERAKININKAYLITGPAGCGKSYLARAVAGSINKSLEESGLSNKIGFKEVKFSDLMWKKDDGISELIKEAQSEAPCILFIDEIHLLRLQTEGNGKALTEFLTVLSGINSDNNGLKPVILIAATNRPDLLDPALLRSGRFEVVKVEKPNFNTRKQYFEIMLKDQGINPENFDIERLSQLTENCSYAQLDQVIKNARFKAKSQARGISSTKDLEDSIDTIVFKLKNESELPISQESKNIIAAHLAGKTLSHILFDGKINHKILKVTLRAKIPAVKESMVYSPQDKIKAIKEKKVKYGNIFVYSKDEIANLETSESLELQIKILLSGAIAEQIILNTQHVVKKSDKTKALELAKRIIYNGVRPEILSKNLQREYESKAVLLLEKLELETKALVASNKEKLGKIYSDLLEKQTLSRSELL